ncbi:MAG: hypothetical protein OEX83_01685 [Gammaproteobacteria bacterium]|nr:hypothetical protein [Gammaproteobacteria bacterium]
MSDKNINYHKTMTDLETKGVNKDYIIGWAGGFWHHPLREEQRVTDAYSAGYEDGKAGNVSSADSWVGK